MKLDFEKLKYELDVDGFSLLNPTQKTIEIASKLSRRFDSVFLQSQDSGYKVNIFRNKDLDKAVNSDFLEFNHFCKNIIPHIKQDLFDLDAIFQTYDTPNSKHIAQDPHFDRIPTLKFMIYLNDLTHDSGAFCLSPGSHHWVNDRLGSKRQSHGAKGFLEVQAPNNK